MSLTTEGQSRPEVSETTWTSGEIGPMGGQGRTPSLNLPRHNKLPTSKPLTLHWQLINVDSDLEHAAQVKQTWPDELEPKEAEPKDERWGLGDKG